MILNPIFRKLRPTYTSIKLIRNMRPIIKMGKEKFQVSIDVRQYNKDEIRVKARPEYVIIEGKQEKKTKRGCVIRQFVRKFKLPDGCHPEDMETKLSSDGILTITARRRVYDIGCPSETIIPIKLADKHDENESIIPVKDDSASNKNIEDKSDDKKP
ncbi:hypothetical protein O3G_MSEX002975 [Manduca sexta]|uniref:SHSP domain-containing protein n=1 Tax=Manduca sexta TaxID=7130 RepID=A0A921YQR4_MANSE|nr:hypothetical protein O3G_MSEX002975 [Manduca sexta]